MRLTFPAMGTTVTVQVVAPGVLDTGSLLEHARDRIRELEARWSRFQKHSEISTMNRHRGSPVVVSGDTLALVRRGVAAHRMTRGLFDPTVHDSMLALGYDRPHAYRARSHRAATFLPTAPTASERIVIDELAGTIALPEDAGFDPGGIAKGFAADIIVAELLDGGAAGACVEVGGDLRVAGEAPEQRGWIIAVEHPRPGVGTTAMLRLRDGGVASTSTLRRRWRADLDDVHHVVDPHSGRPAAGLVGCAAVAATAWCAEVLATAASVAASADPIERAAAAGFLFTPDDSVIPVGDVAALSV